MVYQKKIFKEISSRGEGYVIFARKSPIKTGWKHIGALPVTEAAKVYDLLNPADLTDVYFTLNTFYRIGAMQPNGFHRVYNKGMCRRTGAALPGQRQEVNLQDLRFLYVDMDFYHSGQLASWTEAIDLLRQTITATGIPEPSLVADSGRGLYALWMLRPHSSHARDVDLYKLLNRTLAARIADYAPQLAPDGIYDAARVLRLPGSINGKSDKSVTYSFNSVSPAEPLIYEMEEMAGRLGLCPDVPAPIPAAILKVVMPSTEPPCGYVSTALRRKRQKAGKAGQIALGERRLIELEKVIAARPIRHGFRYKTLLILAATARAAGWSQIATVGLLNAHALKCLPVYPCEANDTPPEALVSLAYATAEVTRHSAVGLAKFFGLSTAECRAMGLSTIYTDEIAQEKAVGERARKKAVIVDALAVLVTAEVTLTSLQRGLKLNYDISLSCSQISRYVKGMGISLKRGRPGRHN